MNDRELMRLENVSKTYERGTEKIYALNAVSISVEKGAFISVVGPSGSGKSTLLHVLGLLDEPTSGRIYIDDTDTAAIDENARARLRGKG